MLYAIKREYWLFDISLSFNCYFNSLDNLIKYAYMLCSNLCTCIYIFILHSNVLLIQIITFFTPSSGSAHLHLYVLLNVLYIFVLRGLELNLIILFVVFIQFEERVNPGTWAPEPLCYICVLTIIMQNTSKTFFWETEGPVWTVRSIFSDAFNYKWINIKVWYTWWFSCTWVSCAEFSDKSATATPNHLHFLAVCHQVVFVS